MATPSFRQRLTSSQRLQTRWMQLAAGLAAIFLAVSFFLTNDSQGGSIELTGKDGPHTVTAAGTVLNQYAVLAAPVTTGETSLSVTDINHLNQPQPLATGDLLLVIQMQGATIQVSQDANFGQVQDYGQAGRYEYIFVSRVSGNTIELSSALSFDYSVAGHTQVIRVPQYTRLDLQAGASVTAPAWDGQRGGVVAFTASDTVLLAAGSAIDVSGRGFRGGVYHNTYTWTQIKYYMPDKVAGEKGESIAGSAAEYASGGYRYGRGAIANGGGGGNAHNAGGGGGSNGASGDAWTGMGRMDGSTTGAAAWALDPAYTAASGLTTSSGGGRGGYTYSSSDRNALSLPPGHSSWGGDQRRDLGGLGGRPLASDPDERLFFGGGGGAGDGNNNAGGNGGSGGGLIFIVAKAVTGQGSLRADGAPGDDTRSGGNDAPAGGGGGGTVVIKALTVGALTISATGGRGGNQTINSNEAEGPGGGGGGGYVALPTGALASVSVAGAAGGSSTSRSVTEFPANGATQGAPGNLATTVFIHYPRSSGGSFPVEFLEVQASWAGEDAQISWATATETNSDYFVLERATDGRKFTSLGQTPAAGFSDEVRLYDQADPGAARLGATRLYYRLRQVDLDGATDYSPVVELAPPAQGLLPSLHLYPNPVQDRLTAAWTSLPGDRLYWEVFSLGGQRLLSGVAANAERGEASIAVSSLSPGRYFLRVHSGAQGLTQAFVKR